MFHRKALIALAALATASLVSERAPAGIISPGRTMPAFTPGEFIRGDANRDGVFNITDPIFTLGYLFADGEAPPCPAAADANGDEAIDLSDAVAGLLALFSGRRLPAPWPEPGLDPRTEEGCDDAGPQPSGPEAQVPAPWDFDPLRDPSYVRLRLGVSPAGLEVLEARILPGPLALPGKLAGDMIYEVLDASGECLGVGSMMDPLSLRGLARRTGGRLEVEDEATGHHHEELPEGSFHVAFPNPYRRTSEVGLLSVRVYRRQGLGAALDSISPEQMAGIRSTLPLEAETAPGDVSRALLSVLEDFLGGLITPPAPEDSVTVLLENGPPGEKKDLVVVGDGFTSSEQDEFNLLVDDLIMKGAFDRDVFKESLSAFNIYRLNAISNDSGVTQVVHTRYQSSKVANPESNNLNKGTLSIAIEDVGVLAIPITDENRSMQKLAADMADIKFNRTNSCGEWQQHQFLVRLIKEGSLGYIQIDAPSTLPGEAGDFSISFNAVQGPGVIPLFTKIKTGSVTPRDTALGYLYSGDWDHCWMQSSCATPGLRDNLLQLVPEWDYLIVFLNETGPGGCGGNGIQVLNKTTDWETVAHELGHGVGGLADEYSKPRKYTGDRPLSPNLDNTTDRDQIKWKDYINPSTPLPTDLADVSDGNHECGAFEGGGTYSEDIYRPVWNCRMNDEDEPGTEFCPVCYTHMREILYPYQGLYFLYTYSGDFDGDGKDDLVHHSGTQLALHLSNGVKLEPAWIATERVPGGGGGWRIRLHDRYFVGDFNGDGKDDLYVFNGQDWSDEYLGLLRSTGDGFVRAARYDGEMPGWEFKINDRFLVADFNGDGRDDLYVQNGKDWGPEYLGMLRSNGGSLTVIRRYDDEYPGWIMNDNDQVRVADFNGDGKDDLYIKNSQDWASLFVGMLRSSGNGLQNLIVYEDDLAGWIMGPYDELHPADFNGDGKDDLYVFNGLDWGNDYLGMFRSNGDSVTFIELYTNTIPGWDLETYDRFHVADVNGDGRDDLYVQNNHDWDDFRYIGILRSSGTGLTGSYHEDVIGMWSLDRNQALEVGDTNGDGKDDLFIHDPWWFGMFRSNGSSLSFQRRYFHWIHNFTYHGPLGHDDDLDLIFP